MQPHGRPLGCRWTASYLPVSTMPRRCLNAALFAVNRLTKGHAFMKYTSNFPLKNPGQLRLLLWGGILLLAACASTPAPNEALQAAELAITNAERARVADFAAPELGTAREKLAAARAAVNEENMVLAERLAEQSRVGAELAIAKAEVGKTQAVNDEMKKSTDVMQQEMQRNRGLSQ